MVHTRTIAKKEHASLRAIPMLPTYTIQGISCHIYLAFTHHSLSMCMSRIILGKEFRALFMSTTEPVDEMGRTTNPTKSPCDRYVFNTVLTRSKSLVVVVGSPYSLLRIEQHMKSGQGLCWNLYMRCCMENKTFCIPPSVECSVSKIKVFYDNLKTLLYNGGQVEARVPQPLIPPPAALPATVPKPKSLAKPKSVTKPTATHVICKSGKSPVKTMTSEIIMQY